MNFNQIKAQASAITAQAKAKALSVDYKGFGQRLKEGITVEGFAVGSMLTSALYATVADDFVVIHPDGSEMEHDYMKLAIDDVVENPGSEILVNGLHTVEFDL